MGLSAAIFDLRSQIRRSAVSIMSSIAEGQGRRTDKDFANFLNIALGSVRETKSHLYIAVDLEYITQETFNDLYAKLDEAGKIVLRTQRPSKKTMINPQHFPDS